MIAFFAMLPGWIIDHRGPLSAVGAGLVGGAIWAAVSRRQRNRRLGETRYGSSSRDPFRRD